MQCDGPYYKMTSQLLLLHSPYLRLSGKKRFSQYLACRMKISVESDLNSAFSGNKYSLLGIVIGIMLSLQRFIQEFKY